MIEVENLVKRYGSHLAVDHLSFQVEPGKIYGFLGPNGAGKSTTMNIMTGYIAATEGTVRINGFDILKDAEEAKKSIGYLPEIPPLYLDMTVEEYLKFAAALKKLSREDGKKQIAEIMELTMIYDIRERLIRNLSKGYRQRVGLAQAVLGYPEVIILDEPMVGLDPKQMIEIRDLIRKLGEKHTVILSSHILSEVQAVCDEIMIISKGKLVACDTPEGLKNRRNGTARLELHILGAEAVVEAAVKVLKGVQAYHFEASGEAGCVKTVIETEGNTDIREALFYILAERKLPIMSMNRIENSLEDIFLALTGENGDAEETDKDKGEKESKEDILEGSKAVNSRDAEEERSGEHESNL